MSADTPQIASVLVLQGPNLNLLGLREPAVYGATTLQQIHDQLHQVAGQLHIQLETFQSNSEGALVDRIHAAKQNNVQFILINPGAYTHTSVAIRDALAGVAIPFIEVHLSNIYQRESFRHHSFLSDIAVGVICGLGAQGYELALQAAHQRLTQ
ncbi:type II 3-dehydroquinate dehydratase [Polynucleobacter kasalickyi]|uniref:3-dehydroquinate dehydratase n=1 Tax=Polynucleobacter kasalickyi TaxID=1938817 RepID=A0A1W2A9H9_9BURK|nr:type II 3-dehydroquinate dehydratase [Polynucleobacter kasalickyi]SMC57243.1 3-dehydroquinate dehydratase [Polynucleobacter kasalickyi]